MPPVSPSPPAPADLLPTADRLESLRELMSAEELRELYLIFAERARDAALLLGRQPGQLGDDELELCVHDIKGTAANLGLDRVADAAATVLETVRTAGPVAAARTTHELVTLLEHLPAALASDALTRLLTPAAR
jgi:HPt (histidine-containing phosphotransfer) domain-containing protein